MIFHDLRKSGNREGGLDCGNIFPFTRKRVYRIRGQAHSGQALIFVQPQCNYSAIYRQSYFLEGQGSPGHPHRRAQLSQHLFTHGEKLGRLQFVISPK